MDNDNDNDDNTRLTIHDCMASLALYAKRANEYLLLSTQSQDAILIQKCWHQPALLPSRAQQSETAL